MTFKVIDKRTGKEPTNRVIDNIAKKGGLMVMDIDQFFVGEDGTLVLADDCGKITYCDTERFKVIAEQELKVGHWIRKVTETENDDIRITYECSECGNEELFEENYCPNCGAKMESWDNDEA